MHTMHILLALVIAFPLGLFEWQSCVCESSGSNFVIEEIGLEILEVGAAPHIEPQSLYLDLMLPATGLAVTDSRIASEVDFTAVKMSCVQQLGCRPPPC